jgi:hypothetical protein
MAPRLENLAASNKGILGLVWFSPPALSLDMMFAAECAITSGFAFQKSCMLTVDCQKLKHLDNSRYSTNLTPQKEK